MSRLFCHSGFIWCLGVTKEVFNRPSEYPNFNFINVLKEEFKNELYKYISPQELLLNHTLCKHYLRFLPRKKKEEAFARLLKINKD